MTTYALLIYRTSPPSVPIPELEEKQGLVGHRALQSEASRRKDLPAVARLDEPSTARTVRARATGHDIMDGPFIESKEWLVGFYLVNIGFITLTLSYSGEPQTWPETIRFLSGKVGLAVLVLGGMHFFNMHAIARFGRKVSDWLVEGQAYRRLA